MFPRNGLRTIIRTGEEVQARNGRIGIATLVRRDEVWVRFPGQAHAGNIRREDVHSTRWLREMAEVDEDEANAAAYRERSR